MSEYIPWGKIGRSLLENYEKKTARLHELAISARKFEYDDFQTMKDLECSGRIKLFRFDNAFDYLTRQCGVQIGHMQEKLFAAIRTTFLPLMFGSDLVNNIKYFKKKFGQKEIFDMFAGLYPRREGKTVITTIAAAIFLVTQPKGNVICYNLSKRQADGWMDQLINYLSYFKNSDDFGWTEVDKSGKEKYSIKAKATGTTNNVYSYPCGLTDGKINMGNDFFIPEEKIKTHTHTQPLFLITFINF